MDHVESYIAATAGEKAGVNYDNPKWVHIFTVNFYDLFFPVKFGVLIDKSILHFLKLSIFILLGPLLTL